MLLFFVAPEVLKQQYVITYFDRSHVTTRVVDIWLLVMSFCVTFFCCSRSLKAAICHNLLWSKSCYHTCCWYIITGNVILCYFFCCTLCTPVEIYLLYICETEKEPINPTGFPAPFAYMIIHCCNCYLSCYLHFMLIWPWCTGILYIMIDGKQ